VPRNQSVRRRVAHETGAASLEKTIVTRFDPGSSGERADQEVERLGRFSEIGVQAAMGYLVGCEDPRIMEAMATKVIPQLERL
jgi:hypothetical protein